MATQWYRHAGGKDMNQVIDAWHTVWENNINTLQGINRSTDDMQQINQAEKEIKNLTVEVFVLAHT